MLGVLKTYLPGFGGMILGDIKFVDLGRMELRTSAHNE